jgi:hypothetical protein
VTEPILPSWITLEPGERILFHEVQAPAARPGAHAITLGLYRVWRRRAHFIVTTLRVMAVRGLVSRDQQEIPARLVRSAEVKRSATGATVWVSTVGGALGTQPFGPMGRTQADAFAAAVRRSAEGS